MTIDPQQPPFAPEPSPTAVSPAGQTPGGPPPVEPSPVMPPLPLFEPAAPPPRKPWGFWATLGWGVLILVVFNLITGLIFLAFFLAIRFGGGMEEAAADINI